MDKRVSNVKQSKVRKQKFSHDQYWCLGYTEVYKNKTERDFKTVIKARSAELAKNILIKRLKEDKFFLKIRTVSSSMVHAKWQIAALRRPLSVTQWEAIRAISFPNDWNRLFKFEKPRREGQLNRYNVPRTILTEEHKNKLKTAALDLVEKYVRNSFKPLCPELIKECSSPNHPMRKGFASMDNPEHRAKELQYLKDLMKDHGGNIAYAKDTIKRHRTALVRAMRRFPEVDWKKEFPLTYTRPAPNSMESAESRNKLSETLRKMGHKPPPNKKGTKQYKKWKKAITATWEAKKEKLYSQWKERVIDALRENDHKRTETAEALGTTNSHLIRLMKRFVEEDPEFEKEFWSPEISMRLKNASCRKTRKENRLKFIKENKHLILQAYYQNEETDYKAAKLFKVDTRTFRRWREEIEQYEE